MGENRDSVSDHQAKQDKADRKVSDQEGVVRRLNGSAFKHPEEQGLLNEMRQNKAAIDLNRAMFEYQSEEAPEPNGEPGNDVKTASSGA